MLGECLHVPPRIVWPVIVVQLKGRFSIDIGLIGFPPNTLKNGVGRIIGETSRGHFAGELYKQNPHVRIFLVELQSRFLEFIFAGFDAGE